MVLDVNQRSQVGRLVSMQDFVDCQPNLEVDPLLDGEPVESFKYWCYVIEFASFCNCSGQRILDPLESENTGLGNAGEERVTVIKTVRDKCVGERYKCRGRNKVSDSAYISS